jgi:hypothetical protein
MNENYINIRKKLFDDFLEKNADKLQSIFDGFQTGFDYGYSYAMSIMKSELEELRSLNKEQLEDIDNITKQFNNITKNFDLVAKK